MRLLLTNRENRTRHKIETNVEECILAQPFLRVLVDIFVSTLSSSTVVD